MALAAAVIAVSVGCGSSPAKPSVGIVPPDLRDVEREGEGLVTTTFGELPARTPDWMRAAGVLSLLKQVWARAKSATPGLPQSA